MAEAALVELARADAPDRRRVLFDGFVNHPTQCAAALLLLARVARSRFYLPPGMVAARIAAADPVITASVDMLRFESFSACCGVAVRYDVLPGGLDRPPGGHGTTNVDLNAAAREVLSGVRGIDPLHLRVTDSVTFATLDRSVTEDRVPLPRRWVRGFAEAQSAGARLVRRWQVPAASARRFWAGLPRTDGSPSLLHVAGGARGLTLTGRPSAGTVAVGGPSRLRVLEPLLGLCTSITVYGPPDGVGHDVSLWQLDLPDGRVSCALSPTSSRGFSGEGGLLRQLATDHGEAYAERMVPYLDDGSLVDVDALLAVTGLSGEQVAIGLTWLGAHGVVGYDAAAGGYFHRKLPWSGVVVEALNPRLAAARKLVEAGAVTVLGELAEVRHGDSYHRVRGAGSLASCTCPWFAQHGLSRGPCKHVLAVELHQHAR